MEDSIKFAQKFVEDLLSFFGLNAVISATHDEDVIQISVPSTHLNGFLIGHNGETLRSIQTLVSAALWSTEQEYTRVNVDVANYKKQNDERLAEKVEGWIKKVRESKEDMELEMMNAAQRRVVHKVISEAGDDLQTESVGEGRDRHIVIRFSEQTILLE